MDTVRIGIIGLGNIGKLHCGYMSDLEGAELTALCDIDPARFEELGKVVDFDHQTEDAGKVAGEVETFTDYREMLDSGTVDCIIIATPHYFHREMAIAAFKRNIHVICEKPVAITAREARAINAAHKESHSVFGIMFQMRTDPTYIKIKEMLEDGTLGEVRRISWIITSWFRTQYYYNSGGWRGNWTGEGGGVLMNQCPHNLDLFQWFFGLPTRLTAMGYLGRWHDITVEDDISVLMEMENGATASFITSTADTPGTNRLEITAENGKLIHEPGQNPRLYRLKRPVQEIIDGAEKGFYSSDPELVEVEVEDSPSGHQYITQNVVDCILGEEKLISPGTEGLHSLALANAMLYAGIRGERIDFPVPEEKFEKFLDALRAKERREEPDKAFDWEEFLQNKR